MDLHRPGNSAHRARSDAVFARGFQRRLTQLWVRGQPQIIVRRQIDDFLAVKRADRRLLVLQHAQLEVRAFGFEFVELVGEIGERVRAGCSSHENLVAADERAP